MIDNISTTLTKVSKFQVLENTTDHCCNPITNNMTIIGQRQSDHTCKF